uniref:Uncharacterized protein n=1 Tax=Anguilla anguilla TaxID=7936 RepID=A0A0E9QRA0_ANGAN
MHRGVSRIEVGNHCSTASLFLKLFWKFLRPIFGLIPTQYSFLT